MNCEATYMLMINFGMFLECIGPRQERDVAQR